MSTNGTRAPRAVASTGIAGLDDILDGGFTRDRLFLVEGTPGSGKTTLALQFLMAGVSAGEQVLYVTLSETASELQAVAESHGWTLDGIAIQELTPTISELEPDEQNTMFHPSELELVDTARRILSDVERLKPTRVVFDSLSELRLLAGNPLRYRRQILALKQFFATRKCTVILLDDKTATDLDPQMQSIAHGVIQLQVNVPDYGGERRRLCVSKFRGVKFRGGHHDFIVQTGGIVVFPRLVAAEHRHEPSRTKLSSGIREFDAIVGGGVELGTSTLIVGAAGTGKSTLAAQFASAAAKRQQRSAFFVFDESPQTLIERCDSLGMGFGPSVENGMVSLQQVDPAELTPGEFVQSIRNAVNGGASLIVIDSLNGYLNAMPGERFLTIQLHELLMYLGQCGVATILIGAHQGLIGAAMHTPIDASYLADAVVLLRYFEFRGQVRQAISIMKNRGGEHERTIREFQLSSSGVRVGEPLTGFRGVLAGTPVYDGDSGADDRPFE